jgi:hypothetical protein
LVMLVKSAQLVTEHLEPLLHWLSPPDAWSSAA